MVAYSYIMENVHSCGCATAQLCIFASVLYVIYITARLPDCTTVWVCDRATAKTDGCVNV